MSQQPDKEVFIEKPYFVVDAAVAAGLERLIKAISDLKGNSTSLYGKPTSAGSTRYVVSVDQREWFYLVIRAASATDTVIWCWFQNPEIRSKVSIDFFDEILEPILLEIINVDKIAARYYAERDIPTPLYAAVENIMNQANITASMKNLADQILPKRRGKKREPYNAWAYEQAQQGRSLEDMLDEYMRMRGQDPDDPFERERAFEACRQAIARENRKHRSTD